MLSKCAASSAETITSDCLSVVGVRLGDPM